MSANTDYSAIGTPEPRPVKKKGAPRPGRTIAILFLVIIGFGVLAFAQGSTSIKLGLDLRGGTSVTLKPTQNQGGKITSAAIAQAVSIIRQRVNSFGVSEAEVAAQGLGANSTIVISIPGKTGPEVVNTVGETAELRIRQVLAVGAPNAKTAAAATGTETTTTTAANGKKITSAPAPVASLPTGVTTALNAQYGALDCTEASARQGGSNDDPNAPLVTCDQNGNAKYILGPAEVLGTDIKSAQAAIDQTGSQGWYVLLNFNSSGTTKFGNFTARVTTQPSPQNQGAIVLDGLVQSAPVIQEAIKTGNAQITGNFSQAQATNLADVLKYGALPLTFTRDSVEQVSPTLGSDQLRAGLLAGALGLLLVVLYSFLYYRGLGFVSVGSLAVAALITLLSFLLLGKAIGFTLTLAGIAGAIVSIGITADSFIVYFERLRDEVREGKSLKTAVETGWKRARRTILVADFVSLIASILLYFFTVSSVRGFAFTLGLTTLVDLLVVFFFTKPLVSIFAHIPFYANGHNWSGFSRKSLGLPPLGANLNSQGDVK
jgi:preprotein translocase subunit SecD